MASDRGSSLDQFVDFALATRQAALSDPDKLVSQALNYRTHFIPLILKGQKEILQGGTEVCEFLQLKYADKFQWRNFNDTFSFAETDSLVKATAPWRWFTVDTVVHQNELDFNQGGRDLVFKRIKKAKMAEMEASYWEGMENALWAPPDNATMESSTLTGTGKMYSIRSFITKDGGAPTAANTGATGTWTTIHGITVASYPHFKNQFEDFDNTSAATRSSETDGILPAMDRMWMKCQYKSPDSFQQYAENTTLSKMRIVGNMPSIAEMTKIARGKNNVLTPVTDVGYTNGKVTFHGLPLDYVDRLNSIDTDAATPVAGDDAQADDGASKLGYRFRFLNLNHFRLIMHSKHNRAMTVKDGGVTNPFAKVMLEDTALNLMCLNRREQGIVFASA